MGRRLLVAVVAAASVLLIAATPAYAIPHVLGYQYSTARAGLVGRVWAYDWSITESDDQWAGHVSSMYINADGLSAPVLDNYIEAGLEKSSSTMVNDSRPVFFHAYEDYPRTTTQVWRSHGRADVNRWHDIKIANYLPYAGTPSDWCVYFDGVCMVDSAVLSFKLGQPITASERYLALDSNYSSFDNMKTRLQTGNHAEWTSIATRDADDRYKPFIVDGSAWRCVRQ